MVKISQDEQKYINDCIEGWQGKKGTFSLTATAPEGAFARICNILLWNPGLQLALACPIHPEELLYDTLRWTNYLENDNTPRLLYNCGRNTLLVSSLYGCQKCSHPWQAHHPGILQQCGAVEGRGAFYNMHIHGVTREMYRFVSSMVKQGVSFQGLRTSIKDSYKGSWSETLHWKVDVVEEVDHNLTAFKIPSEQFLREVFMLDHSKKKELHLEFMNKIPVREASLDMTFKIG